jgi:hypothetical protein
MEPINELANECSTKEEVEKEMADYFNSKVEFYKLGNL